MTIKVVSWNIAKRRKVKVWKELLDPDHVFASRGFHENVRTRALNDVDVWGASDHCRLPIEVGAGQKARPGAGATSSR